MGTASILFTLNINIYKLEENMPLFYKQYKDI